MSRRNRRGRWLGTLGILLLGIAASVALTSVVIRSCEPPGPPQVDGDLRVEVLNGCGSPGAADRVAMILRRHGLAVENTGNADHFHYRNDIVVARRVSRARAEPLGRILAGAIVVEQRLTDHDYDITVIVGKPRSLLDGD
jgi:hypothetical protein